MAQDFDNLPKRQSMGRSNPPSHLKQPAEKKTECNAEAFFNADTKSLRSVNNETDEQIATQIIKLVERYKASYGQQEEKELADYLEAHNLQLRISPVVEKNEKSEVARLLFDGCLRKPLDAKSLKPDKFTDDKKRPLGCSPKFIEAINTPAKYNWMTPESYDLSASSVWNVFEQVPEFAAIKDKMLRALAKENIPPEILPSMNVNDFKYLMYYHCCLRSKKREDAPGYLFFEVDENGRAVRDSVGRPNTTSKKKENLKQFIKKYKKEFSRKLMSMPGIKKDYVKALTERMEKDGCTDMGITLKDHPEWKDQPAFNMHHIINIKDCRVLEEQGRPFYEVNNLDNMCLVTNGTLENSLQQNNYRNNNFKGNVHKLLHLTDFNFNNKSGEFEKPSVAIRIEPRKGVCAMLGFTNHHVIVDNEYKSEVNADWRGAQYAKLMTQNQGTERV